ncbi:MAG: DUF3883 domain-containing protein [Lachnospiraceae bacterium]|nr:DUF3883 domain-containing protein [Lachnospiraceae bacterium]
MAELNWPSDEDKYEAIGYLAAPGVIASIEATVPKGQKEQFRKEYEGKYSDEYPYEADKYGKQFRIYLNDTDGCPDFLREHLDGTYGNRINNTEFITELVKEYGFKFTKQPQDSKSIRQLVLRKIPKSLIDPFNKGYNGYNDFIQDIGDYMKKEEGLPLPNLLQYKEKTISKRTEQRASSGEETVSAYSSNQILKLGWVGEEYIAYLLRIKDATLLNAIGLSVDSQYEVEWFNQGFQNATERVVFRDLQKYGSYGEYVKDWDDQSVGKGCDIVVTPTDGDSILIEVKSSRRAYPYFSMTSVEMQEMELKSNRYVLIKLNNLERLLQDGSPDIIVIMNPYEKLFHPKHMKEATFIIGGK